jgi:hypothetical protein
MNIRMWSRFRKVLWVCELHLQLPCRVLRLLLHRVILVILFMWEGGDEFLKCHLLSVYEGKFGRHTKKSRARLHSLKYGLWNAVGIVGIGRKNRLILPLGYFLEGSRDHLLSLNTRACSVPDSSRYPWSRVLETRIGLLLSWSRHYTRSLEQIEMEEHWVEVSGRLLAPAVLPLEERTPAWYMLNRRQAGTHI